MKLGNEPDNGFGAKKVGSTCGRMMRSKEQRNLSTWLLEKMMQIAPGRMVEFFINRSTRRIHQAANAINLKDYFRLIEPGGGSRLMCLVAAYVVTRMDHVIRPRQLHGHWGHCSSPVKLKARDIARDFFTRGGRQDRR